MVHRYNLRSRIGWRGESGEVKELSKVRIVMAKVRFEPINTDIFMAVVAPYGDELPLFTG